MDTTSLNRLSTESAPIRVRTIREVEGIMNGKMDLFFYWEGKYYLLDWKSNFLGDNVEEYDESGLQEAMNENNYHLQYLIYTLAAKKYLESRLPLFDYEKEFGGVIYLFLRGIRKEAQTGIFAIKPLVSQIEKLEEMLAGDVIA
ncbi:MAG: hypothetical protein EOO10_20435 [Chitinophagaceae bacterium]|nr:MAG: hypothetical protein EOO10_20435 [Chitinophagaceae bacterium]